MSDTPFEKVAGYFKDAAIEGAVEVLARYYAPGYKFSGSAFDELIARSPTDRYTSDDILAVTTLSVDVHPRAFAPLLAGHANTVLRQIPADVSLWERPDLLDAGQAPWRLWDLVRLLHQVGPTITSKLLAAKRPALIPIFDERVATALGLGPSPWAFWQQVAQHKDAHVLISAVHRARDEAKVPAYVTDLRVIDVVIWSQRQS